jgi:hypothetical protein
MTPAEIVTALVRHGIRIAVEASESDSYGFEALQDNEEVA